MSTAHQAGLIERLYERVRAAPTLNARLKRHLVLHLGFGTVLVVASLILGTLGFWALAGQKLDDAAVNTAMLLGGMGPTGKPEPGDYPIPGKIFATVFALYAGLVFVVMVGLVGSPLFHHALRLFHAEKDEAMRKPGA